MNDFEKQVMTDAIERYGYDAQMLKAVEESSELTVALMHYRDDKATRMEVLDEIADNVIMCSQVATILGFTDEDVEIMVTEKLDRLYNRMKVAEMKEAEDNGSE